MKEMGIVQSVLGNEAKLTPVTNEACLACSGGCDKKGTILEANIPSFLTITPGMTVYFECNRKERRKQGLISLFIPFLCAVSGYFTAPAFMNLIKKECGDGIRAAFVLGFMFLSSGIIFLINRKKNHKKHLNITAIVE